MPVVSPKGLAAYERGEIDSSPLDQFNSQSAVSSAAYVSTGHDRIVRGTRGPRLRELRYRYHPRMDADGKPIYLGPAATNPAAIMPTLKRLLAHEAVEVFGVLCLTTRRQIICWHEVSRGSVDRASVNVREVFIPALMINAPAIVIAHNHPSGEPAPSAADVESTEQILQAGRLMGIDVVDHVADKVESGLYNNASEVVRASPRLLKEQDDLFAKFREDIEIGWQQARAGLGIDGAAAFRRTRARLEKLKSAQSRKLR